MNFSLSIYSEREKRRHPRKEHLPRGYATVMQDISSNGNGNHSNNVRPVSNIYLEPSEINTSPPLYEQVVNETTPPRPKPSGQTEDLIPLMYVGGAASAENLAAAPSGASGAMSGSGSITGQRQNVDDEYVEMSTEFIMRSKESPSPAADGINIDYVNSGEVTGACCQASMSNEDPKFQNLYTCPMTVSDYIKENGESVLQNHNNKDKEICKKSSPEMHIYSNKLDNVPAPLQRPLPPVPSSTSTKP